MIHRNIFSILKKELKNNKITVITGSRQVGKTTAMKVLFEEIKSLSNFITFDNSSIRQLFEENPDLFIEQHIKPYDYIFIDEFQYAKKGGKVLKYIYDITKKKIIISGSSKPDIAIQSLQYLVGRVSLIEMYPLSFYEFVSFKSPEKKILLEKPRDIISLSQLNGEFEEYLMFGGYPEVVLEKNFEDKKKILKDIIQIYLLKEIKDVLGYKNSYEYEKLLKIIAINNGKLTKISTLSNVLDISWNTVQENVSILSKTNILFSIQPFFSNKSKEIVKTSKYYFHDIGFVNSLLNNFSRINERVDKGEILESFVLHELLKKNYIVKFWNRQFSEVDFVLEKDGKIIGIECKSNIEKIPRSLNIFFSEYDCFKAYVFNLKNDYKTKKKDVLIKFLHYMNVSSIDFFG